VENFQPTPYLVMHSEAGSRQLPLAGSSCWTIGRSEDNNVVIPDRWISRNHALLQCMENGEFFLIDLGSRNGSFVNGRRVSVPLTLRNGDRLTFGQTEIDFFCPSEQPHPPSGSDSQGTLTSTLHIRRLITVMVVDIRDFTVLTRQLDEKILSAAIGTWFRHAGNIIRESGSWVDKYIGDAVMAVWFHGSKNVSNQEILSVLRAVNVLHKMTANLHHHYPLPFPLRIGAGVNTGFAMVGNTGSGDRPDYTALGDTVNAAFRLESATKQLGLDVALGETTYKYLTDIGNAKEVFNQYTVHLKGYDQETITYASSFEALDSLLPADEKPLPSFES